MAITLVDHYGYLLTSCFCDQKGLLNKMRPPTEDPGGYKFFPMLTHGLDAVDAHYTVVHYFYSRTETIRVILFL